LGARTCSWQLGSNSRDSWWQREKEILRLTACMQLPVSLKTSLIPLWWFLFPSKGLLHLNFNLISSGHQHRRREGQVRWVAEGFYLSLNHIRCFWLKTIEKWK
jgi:hypothetical protein